jgi:predicted dehydrogenase
MSGSALVVGLGSIGTRHARLLGELGLDVAAVSRHGDDTWRCHATLADALERETPSYVVIANETALHHGSVATLAGLGFAGTVLVEKPLFDRPAPLPTHRFAGLYVGYNLRFHPVMAELKQLLALEPALSAQVYVGQYLPDWRPGRDYRATASASRAAGGGVLRDLSHELDYLLWLFGPCEHVAALAAQARSLDIDSDAVQGLLLAFARCPVVTAQLNYLDRQAAREIVVNTPTRTIRADLIRGTLRINDEERHFPVERDATYLEQHRSALGNGRDRLCTATEGAAALALIAAAERAAAERRWVAP